MDETYDQLNGDGKDVEKSNSKETTECITIDGLLFIIIYMILSI